MTAYPVSRCTTLVFAPIVAPSVTAFELTPNTREGTLPPATLVVEPGMDRTFSEGEGHGTDAAFVNEGAVVLGAWVPWQNMTAQ